MIRQPLTVANALIGQENPFALPASPFDVPVGIDESGATQQTEEPFVWGAGGSKLTPDQLAAKQKIAADLMKSNYAPAGSFLEAIGRGVSGVTGALEQKQLDKEQAAQASSRDQIAQALLGGNSGAAGAAILSGDPGLGKLGELAWAQANPKAPAPHYFESNSGDQYVIGADGQPQRIFYDPDPKAQFVPDGFGGGTFAPVPRFSAGGGGQASTAGAGLPAIGSVMADPRKQGGQMPPASGSFR